MNDDTSNMAIEKEFFDLLGGLSPFRLRLCLRSAGAMTTDQEIVAWHGMKSQEDRERYVRAVFAALGEYERHRAMTDCLRLAAPPSLSPPAGYAWHHAYDSFINASTLLELFTERYFLRNDYGHIGSYLGCRVIQASGGFARYAVWQNVLDGDDYGIPTCDDVVAELRAWLPTVELEEIGFDERFDLGDCWLMLVQITKAHPAWNSCNVDRYREVETQINAWLFAHYDFTPSGATSAAATAPPHDETGLQGPNTKKGDHDG